VIGLVGRHTELAELRQLLGVPARPLEVTVSGPAGVGKTSMMRAMCDELAGDGRTLLVSRPTEASSLLPYATLLDLLDPIADEQLLSDLPGPQRAALEVVLLRHSSGEAPVSRLAVCAGTLGVIQQHAERAPVLLAIDDVQWVDEASAQVLAFVLRRTGPRDVTLLTAVRSSLRSAIGHDHGGVHHALSLHGLDLDGLDELIRSRLGRRLLLPGLVQLRRLCEGNPMVALEVVRSCTAEDAELRLGTAFGATPELSQLLRRRLDQLSGPARQLLELAATAGAPPVELLQKAATEHDVPALLREAEREELLVLEGDGARFTHPLFSAAVLDAATPPERRAAHQRLAGATDDEVDRARHLAAALVDPDEQAAMVVERGARQAFARAAPAAAAGLYEEALRLTPAELSVARARRAAESILAWNAAGAPGRGVRVGEETIGDLPFGVARGRLLAALSEALELTRGAGAAKRMLERAAGEVASDDIATALVLRRLAWMLAVEGDLHAALRVVQDALAAAESGGDDDDLAAALAAVAMIRFLRGEPDADVTLERARVVASPDANSPARRDLERDRAVMATWADHPDAWSLVTAQQRGTAERGDAEQVQYSQYYQHLIRLRTGDWGEALAQMDAFVRDSERLGIEAQSAVGLWLRALTEACLGQVDAARRDAELGIAAARTEEMNVFALWCEAVLGFLELSLGEHEVAADRLWRLHGCCEAAGFGEPGHLRHLADVVEALMMAGRTDEARVAAGRLEEMASRTGNRWAAAAAVRCRGLVQESSGDREAAITELRAAVTMHESLGQPLELGRTLLLLGGVLRRDRKKAEARTALDRAAEIFAALPAPLWLDRTADEQARVGGGSTGRWELSATERRIAELVASGRTNREVAAALFLSPKTDEWNLSKVYRKLRVRSRSELAAAWRAGTTEPKTGGVPGSREPARP
jgi:DNA-binding CsgD family transcriptional regulator